MSELIQHYESLFETHGSESVESVQAASVEQQNRRFQILFEMKNDMNSILDVGCGLGHMLKFMQNSNSDKSQINYFGVDFTPSFIDYCQKNLSSDFANFQISDLNKSENIILLCLAVPVLFFGFYPEPLINTIEISVKNLIDVYNFNLNMYMQEVKTNG